MGLKGFLTVYALLGGSWDLVGYNTIFSQGNLGKASKGVMNRVISSACSSYSSMTCNLQAASGLNPETLNPR